MMTRATDYDVKCMLCSAEVGQIVSGKFSQHDGCRNALPRKAGMPRCCHCGGSLYLDPIDIYQGGVDRAQIRRILASTAA